MKKLKQIGEVQALYHVPTEAVDFLQSLCGNTPNGRYEFGESCFVVVSSYETKILQEDMKPEAHEAYVDVQYLALGTEKILYTDKRELTLTDPYDPARDIAFYQYDARTEAVTLGAGEAVVLDTDEAHLPNLAVDEPCAVKKAVLKIKK